MVELESNDIESYRVFSMSDPFRLVVDVKGKKTEVTQPPQQPEQLQQPQQRAQQKQQKQQPPRIATRPEKKGPLPSLARQLGLEISRIVIDPGHGGKDKGAIGPNNTYEKDIVLAVAKQLKPLLQSKTGCEVILTRTKDVYLSLEQRTAIANTNKADLFISIHANAHSDRSKHGVETYFLNLAKDQESARVAALENATSTRKISDLESILKDLLLNTKVDESARLAGQVQSHLIGRLKTDYDSVRDLGTKQAPFYVLMGAEMPSILIETSFISNPVEEERLKNRQFQKCLAESICNGIQSYMEGIRTASRLGGRS
jgi:N-acetylmuramoyl-L-alanine amidase